MTSGKPRILVVDDEQTVRGLCREFLELHDYIVDEARNGTEALELMSRTSFSLILSDIMMPDINGLELASIVRKRFPDTLVILITGHGTIDLAKDAIQRGAFDFVTKPFKMTELKGMVDRALEVRSKQLSVLPSPELKDLYDLTVNVNISEQSIKAYLDGLATTLRKTFRGDVARVYLGGEPGVLTLSRMAGSGNEQLLSEKEWTGTVMSALEIDGGVLDNGEECDCVPESSPVTSLMAVPVPSSDGNLGACIVARSTIPVEFTSRDLKLMGLFAAQAGNQLMNYRMASNLRIQADNLERTNLLAGEFSSSLNTRRVLATISRGLRSVLSFDLFGVFLSSKDMMPLSYMLVRSDMPEEVLQGDFRTILQKKLDIQDVELFLNGNTRDSFASLADSDYDTTPLVELLDLGDIGSLRGMIVLSDWSGTMCRIGTSSHIPILLRHAAAALSNAFLFETNERNYIQTIAALAGAVDAKDPYTHNHSRNVAAYVTSIAAHMRLPSRDISLLNSAALLHDIGKIGIPENILNKAGPLSEEEFYIIKTHPEVGYNILRPVTAFGSFIDAVRYHHEKYDGSGYPAGLSNDSIPLHARMLSVADGFDAMTSDRIYRKAPGLDYAIREINENIGSQFDPEIGRIFLSVLESMSPDDMINEYLSKASNQLSFNQI
ncbi:MAG: response regulator [Candidatus Fermentibacteraceae bacterium]|nr:response regulator [Candidatus Fermentibacteraceae bacterium]